MAGFRRDGKTWVKGAACNVGYSNRALVARTGADGSLALAATENGHACLERSVAEVSGGYEREQVSEKHHSLTLAAIRNCRRLENHGDGLNS